jgi:uncharacterized protein YegL
MENNMSQEVIQGTTLQFSYTRPEDLGASEYTLVTIVVDISSSVDSFKDDLLKAVQTAIRACKKSPRAENLLLRLVTFNTRIVEIHGFIALSSIDPDTYDPFNCLGCTALYDATHDCIGATLTYAKTLTDMDFDVNAITFIITDGEDNSSHQSSPSLIKDLVTQAKRGEEMESITNILIGINSGDAGCFGSLSLFKDEADLSQFIEVQDTTPGKLAKLAQFVSQSVSSASQALGSGGPSQLLNF